MIEKTNSKVNSYLITGVYGLDPIRVYVENLRDTEDRPVGRITISCWGGTALTACFDSPGTPTLEEFIRDCGADYLLVKLTSGQKPLPKYKMDYLKRIVEAIKEEL